jgi:hypothetical protein
MSALAWRKSSYSSGNGDSCVEAAVVPDAVLVRDTTNRGGFTLSVPCAAWAAFLSDVRAS